VKDYGDISKYFPLGIDSSCSFIYCGSSLSSKKIKLEPPFTLILLFSFEMPRLIVVFLPQPNLDLPNVIAWIVGAIIFLVALSFAVLGGHQIRTGAMKEPSGKRKLETSGVYGIVRHPIYFGDTFWPVGLSIMFNAAYSLLLTPLWFILLFLFSIVEEEKLVEEYGKEYEEYMQKVPKRIIPCVL
jgi:protein-S-isoprenylcysteine O-methyltransferase Ste14